MPEQDEIEKEVDIFFLNSLYPKADLIFTPFSSLEDIKGDCYIVLDTNVLLIPYQTSKESLQEIQRTYKTLADEKRLIVPGQVAREFAKNRAIKLSELYSQLLRKKSEKQRFPTVELKKYPLLEFSIEYQETIRLDKEIQELLHTTSIKYDELIKNYGKTLDKVLSQVSSWTWNDPVSSIYSSLFTKDVILDLSIDEKQKEEMKKELYRRYSNQIPPGYKDKSKPDDNGIGDLLIWYTILKIGEIYKKSVIFVSGEEKADWQIKSEGQSLYPRYELIDEFKRHSEGQSFHIVKFSDFLKLYEVSKDVLEEVRKEETRVELLQIKHHSTGQNFSSMREMDFVVSEAVFEWLQTSVSRLSDN